MAEVKVYYDQVGNTLTVWFGSPHDEYTSEETGDEVILEYTSEETGDEVILMKDRNGKAIGFEKLNYSIPATTNLKISFETATV